MSRLPGTEARDRGVVLVPQRGDIRPIEVELIGPQAETNPFTLDENRRMVSTREHDWHAVIAAQAQPHPAEEPLYHIASAPPIAPWAVVFVRFPSKERDVFSEFRKKLETERKQLSGVEGPRVIALDATTLADTFQLDADRLREMLLKFMRSAPSLACVWLVMRRWQTSLRYRYEGIYIPNPDSVYQLPSWFEHGLFQNEWRVDFLTGAEFCLSRRSRSRLHATHAVTAIVRLGNKSLGSQAGTESFGDSTR